MQAGRQSNHARRLNAGCAPVDNNFHAAASGRAHIRMAQGLIGLDIHQGHFPLPQRHGRSGDHSKPISYIKDMITGRQITQQIGLHRIVQPVRMVVGRRSRGPGLIVIEIIRRFVRGCDPVPNARLEGVGESVNPDILRLSGHHDPEVASAAAFFKFEIAFFRTAGGRQINPSARGLNRTDVIHTRIVEAAKAVCASDQRAVEEFRLIIGEGGLDVVTALGEAGHHIAPVFRRLYFRKYFSGVDIAMAVYVFIDPAAADRLNHGAGQGRAVFIPHPAAYGGAFIDQHIVHIPAGIVVVDRILGRKQETDLNIAGANETAEIRPAAHPAGGFGPVLRDTAAAGNRRADHEPVRIFASAGKHFHVIAGRLGVVIFRPLDIKIAGCQRIKLPALQRGAKRHALVVVGGCICAQMHVIGKPVGGVRRTVVHVGDVRKVRGRLRLRKMPQVNRHVGVGRMMHPVGPG